jgi:hypothetical protein
MEGLLGVSWPVFFGLTVGVFGGCAFMTGQGVAQGWHPASRVLGYTLLLGAADRFLVYALFQGPLWSLSGFVLHTLALLAISMTAYRVTYARLMVSQYPWLYERKGPLSWQEKAGVA